MWTIVRAHWLAIAPGLVAGFQAFQNRSELHAAITRWSGRWSGDRRAEVEEVYGLIGDWDVQAVTSMAALFRLRTDFNADISSWNTSAVTDMSYMFSEAHYFNQSIGSWDTSKVTDMSHMFDGAHAFDQPIGSWNTSAVTDMSCMFCHTLFNQPIGLWDTSKVKSMSSMFEMAFYFNQDIGAWNTSEVIDMSGMFTGANEFNQHIGAWDTSKVTDMSKMFGHRDFFYNSYAFNQPIGSWNTSKVTTMRSMFEKAFAFNQYIGSWDTSAVTDMRYMFHQARAFNHPIGSWATSAVTDMSYMFDEAHAFNQLIGSWDTSAVRDMDHMFQKAYAFNQPIGSWDTSAVVRMSFMFRGAYSFNQPIGSWNTSRVRYMSGMFFNASTFNKPVGSWDTSKVKSMSSMFEQAYHFNQAIGAWNTSEVTDMSSMFQHAEAFEQRLLEWNTSSVIYKAHMFEGAIRFDSPPCNRGNFPAFNGLGCQNCPAGQFAWAGADKCEFCSQGNVPTSDRSKCKPCPPWMYAPLLAEQCVVCNFPRFVHDNDCIWWHLPLIALVAACLIGASCLFAAHRRARHTAKIEKVKSSLYQDLWSEDAGTVSQYSQALMKLGVKMESIDSHIAQVRATQSRVAGVSMKYLLSEDFAHLARQRTGQEDPRFMDMKNGFWLKEDPIGSDLRCPRDGRLGCAMVDWIPQTHRRQQTHFLSWTWQYRLGQVTSALQSYSQKLDTEDIFFFMCFFTNNQFRIIVEGTEVGSLDLEKVFESNLVRIGRMVAILDSWREPVYLSRIWTVYEQFIASKLAIPVTFTMPEAASESLQLTVEGGGAMKGISRALRHVDAEHACAWKEEDEGKVKSMIQETVGFQHVNRHVAQVMLNWIGSVVQEHIHELMGASSSEEELFGV